MTAEEDARRRREEWLAAGAPDYNNPTKDDSGNVTGYHSVTETPPALRSESNQGLSYNETDWTKSRFSDYFKNGGSPAGGGQPGASNPYSFLTQNSNPGGGNMAPGPWDPNDPNDPNAWMRFYDPGNPQNYLRGWQNTMEASGVNPEGNNPYAQWLNDANLVSPLLSNWMVSQALNGTQLNNPTDLYNLTKGFMESPFQSTIQGGLDTLNKLKAAVMDYLNPASAGVGGMLGALANTLMTDDNAAARILGAVMNANMSPSLSRAGYARMQMLQDRYNRQANPGTNSFAEWYLSNYVK